MATQSNVYDDSADYAPRSLNIHMIEGVSYDQAKKLLGGYGVTVLPQDLIWERLSILQIRIPEGEDIDEWKSKLLQSEIAIQRVTKVGIGRLAAI